MDNDRLDNPRLDNPMFIEIPWDSSVKPNEIPIRNSKMLFIREITAEIDEEMLYELFRNAGRGS